MLYTAATNKGWHYYVKTFLKQHLQQLFPSFDIAAVTDMEKLWFLSSIFIMIVIAASDCIRPCSLSTYQYANYLSEVKCFLIGGC